MSFNETKRKFVPDLKARKSEPEYMEVPCGRCHGCRLEYARQWATRLVHEAQQWPDEQRHFITLTFNDQHLPEHGNLDKKIFQDFMKRLRQHVWRKDGKPENPRKIKFYHCGEYGKVCLNCGKSKIIHDREQTCSTWSPTIGRPHYHAILYGVNFDDMELWKRTGANELIYRSKTLESLWPFGHSSIGTVSFESCSYVARYVTKKINGDQAKQHYFKPTEIDKETGEITKSIQMQPEYATMSRGKNNAIGLDWFKKFHSDVYPHDRVVMLRGGTSYISQPPRYYDKKLEELDPVLYKELKQKRLQQQEASPDNTPQRLRVREQVKKAQTKNLTRHFEEHHNDY